MKFFSLLIAGLFISCQTNTAPEGDPLPPKGAGVFRVAFGSCNKHNRPQPLWEKILQSDPDIWVWLGDVIYADTKNMNRMARKYLLQKSNPAYHAFIQKVPVIGTWDDHDFGKNGAKKNYPFKRTSQSLFLDFIGEPPDSPRRKQEGVYVSYRFGAEERPIRIILLDERYFRDRPGPDADILGEAQWAWLQNELSDTIPAVTLIGSSSQIVGRDHVHDKWTDFPAAERRLFHLIRSTKAKNLIVLAGDRHFGEISKYSDAPIGYPLYEITSSGLTHHKNRFWQELFGLEKNRYRLYGPFYNLNYGIVDIDLQEQSLTMFVCNKNGNVQFKQKISTKELQPHAGN